MASENGWRFKRAVEDVRQSASHYGGKWKWSDEDQLDEYKYYNQATRGDIDISEPSTNQSNNEHSKWQAWSSLKGMSKEEASQKYIELVETKKLNKPTSLQRLINEPKGKTTFKQGESFILHVLWVAPSMEAAKELLEGLRQCANATHRDTPCVPTYIFHISSNDSGLHEAPKTLGEHPQLRDAFKKLKVGTPPHAVTADLQRRGLDPSLITQDPSSPLPPSLQHQPVVVEFTEVYLDEDAFMGHVGSTDYLRGYGTVMKPSLQNSQLTFRLGTPSESLVNKILDPILKEVVVPLADNCVVWKRPSQPVSCPIYLSLDVSSGVEVPKAIAEFAITCVTFPHPHRANTTRLLSVMPAVPPPEVLQALSALNPIRGEVFSPQPEAVRGALVASGLQLQVNASEHVGYALHDLVESL